LTDAVRRVIRRALAGATVANGRPCPGRGRLFLAPYCRPDPGRPTQACWKARSIPIPIPADPRLLDEQACSTDLYGLSVAPVRGWYVQSDGLSGSASGANALAWRNFGRLIRAVAGMWLCRSTTCRKRCSLCLWHRLTGRLAGVHINMAERASAATQGIDGGLRPVDRSACAHSSSRGTDAPCLPLAFAPTASICLRWVFSLAHEVVVLGDASREFVLNDLRCDPAACSFRDQRGARATY
jgi:hypothetical protein